MAVAVLGARICEASRAEKTLPIDEIEIKNKNRKRIQRCRHNGIFFYDF
jgi:hypothetical protein